jgi:hypothetical protein
VVVSWVSTDDSEKHIASIFILIYTCFHADFLLSLYFRLWRWRRYVPPKRQLTLNGLHGVISQTIVLFKLSSGSRTKSSCSVMRLFCKYRKYFHVDMRQPRVYSEVGVFREALQGCKLILKVNGSCGIGRQETSEDAVRRLGKRYSEQSELESVCTVNCNWYCNPINSVVNPNPVLYSRHTRDTILQSRCLATIRGFLPSWCLATIGGYKDTHTHTDSNMIS